MAITRILLHACLGFYIRDFDCYRVVDHKILVVWLACRRTRCGPGLVGRGGLVCGVGGDLVAGARNTLHLLLSVSDPQVGEAREEDR